MNMVQVQIKAMMARRPPIPNQASGGSERVTRVAALEHWPQETTEAKQYAVNA